MKGNDMPNWCENEVEITFESKTEYDKFITQAGIEESTSPYLEYNNEEKGYGFFDRFVPTPPEMLEGEGWWDWRINNWGTKWNPNFGMFETDDDALKISLGMSTAWAPPIEFFTTFTEFFPSAIVKLAYLEEGMGFCGKAEFYQGSVEDNYVNNIPTAMYVAAGATLNSDGEVDWDEDQNYNLWEIINNEDEFNKLLEEA
jgi:hypothetical protein